MEGLKAEGMESQNQLPQSEDQGKGTTFLKTCFNGLNALSGPSLPLGKYVLDTIYRANLENKCYKSSI
jgi:vesicular inhibitory amino acid transporter